MTDYKYFDGHNDTLLRLQQEHASPDSLEFLNGNDFCHIDYPRGKNSGFAGGFFALYTPSQLEDDHLEKNWLDPVKFARLEQEPALRFTSSLMARALRLERASEGKMQIVRKADDLKTIIDADKMAMLIHIEGAEAIDTNMYALETLYAAGLRSIGLVWSRPNDFGVGVPMSFPGSPDIGPGLSDAGKELVRACNQMGVMIDLSHLNEKGFWDVQKISDAPLVATHSNVYSLCNNPRNLTDRQLDAIAESKGVVGLNFHVGFLREDGRPVADTDLEVLVRHAAYLVEKLGEGGVAIGSDFDGCLVPSSIGGVEGIHNLARAFEHAQFGEQLIKRIFIENWSDVLYRTLGKRG